MYHLFKEMPLHKLGITQSVQLPYIRRIYAGLIRDVQTYYRKRPKFVESQNLIANIIKQFVVEFRSDDLTYAKKVEDQLSKLVGTLGLNSPVNKGKIFPGVTLGPQTSEVVMASFERFPTEGLGRTWREMKPVRYLYHTRTDVNLPIMNNTTPGKGYGVISVNIPMLLVQYRYWLRHQIQVNGNEVESPMRFVGGYVLPNAIESYLEISWFNRLARNAKGIPNPTYPVAHPFYITDMSARLEQLATETNSYSDQKAIGVEALAAVVPGITQKTLFDIIRLPRDALTLQNEWAIALARFPFIQYLAQMLLQGGRFDRAEMNEIIIDLTESMYDQAFRQQTNNDFMKQFTTQVEALVKQMR
jgi:hypothetical protein